GAATVKRIYYHQHNVELRASNPEVEPIFVIEGQDLEIYGILVGLYRKFNV
ncbi:MAG: peptidase, partial [Deltaproteobacteria bacterium]|nr:peptidase [Deltaproteobacteria bacterium]